MPPNFLGEDAKLAVFRGTSPWAAIPEGHEAQVGVKKAKVALLLGNVLGVLAVAPEVASNFSEVGFVSRVYYFQKMVRRSSPDANGMPKELALLCVKEDEADTFFFQPLPMAKPLPKVFQPLLTAKPIAGICIYRAHVHDSLPRRKGKMVLLKHGNKPIIKVDSNLRAVSHNFLDVLPEAVTVVLEIVAHGQSLTGLFIPGCLF